jgi:hypothetical protein
MKGTIPQDIVSALKLNHGDMLYWEILVENGKIIAKIRKME